MQNAETTLQNSFEQESKGQDRSRLILIAVTFVLLGSAIFFTYQQLTYKSRRISEAEKLFTEFRTAQALETLLDAKNKSNKKEPDLDWLLTYAYINSKRYEEAKKIIAGLEQIPEKYKRKFVSASQTLNNQDRPDLLRELIPKAKKLDLKSDFFLRQSRKRNSIDEELRILEAGHTYLKENKDQKQIQHHLSILENHLLRRYLEIANIYIGNANYKEAVEYLSKATELEVSEDSPYKSELHYNLGLAYKNLKQYSEAWGHIKISAELGNGRAKTMMNGIRRNYVP